MTAAPGATTEATALDPAEQAVLLRLLPATKTAPSPRVVMDTCNKLYRQPPSSEQWKAVLDQLRSRGFLEGKGMRLTPAGRAQALKLLGLSELPPKTTWGTIQSKFLLPKAIGQEALPAKELKRLNTQDKLAALLLARSLQLPPGAEANLKNALESLVCQKLGFPSLCSLEELKEEVLSQHLKSPEKLSSKQLVKQVPRVVLGTKKDGLPPLRDIALAGWADAVGPPPKAMQAQTVFELPAFATAVFTAAQASPTGWFGNNKVFISHVGRQLRHDPHYASLHGSAFKQLLVEANTKGLLALGRADLVQVMDPIDVDESATTFQNATFHFVLVDRKQS